MKMHCLGNVNIIVVPCANYLEQS